MNKLAKQETTSSLQATYRSGECAVGRPLGRIPVGKCPGCRSTVSWLPRSLILGDLAGLVTGNASGSSNPHERVVGKSLPSCGTPLRWWVADYSSALRFDTDPVVDRSADPLFATKVALRSLNRNVAEEELNLFQFSPRCMI